MKTEDHLDDSTTDLADERLQQLLHLKGFETPTSARMSRSRQNIMREVRSIGSKKERTFGELLEMNIPWFFAEPRYGIAALFVLFAGLHFLGLSTQNTDRKTGLYSAPSSEWASASASSSNQVVYPKLPTNFALFPDPQRKSDISFVGQFKETP